MTVISSSLSPAVQQFTVYVRPSGPLDPLEPLWIHIHLHDDFSFFFVVVEILLAK